jgi:hypothetical protein
MELGEFYPEPDELVGHELAVLDYLRNQPYIKESHSQFAQDAANYFARNKVARKGFEFFSWLDVVHSEKKFSHKTKPNMRLVIAALIERKGKVYSNVSYCLVVCNTRSLAVLRKFHFDITATAGSSTRRQPHPRCHLQYSGKIIPEMEKMGIRRAQLNPLYPSLSEPRIFTWPMSLALLIDLTLHEFSDVKTKKFRAAPEWQSIIHTHENTVLRPFFEKCLQVMKNRGNDKQTLADAFYVS